MLKSLVTADSLRLIAIDIDGTLLNPEFHISETDLAALRNANAQGIEVILVTGRRHTFALPIAKVSRFLTPPKSTGHIQTKNLSEKHSRQYVTRSLSQPSLASTTKMGVPLIVNQSTSEKWWRNH